MRFSQPVQVSAGAVAAAMGDATALAAAQRALSVLKAAARPGWACRRLPVQSLPTLPGQDIQRHLAGCREALLLAVTLGHGVDDTLRSEAAADMAGALWLDTAAGLLAERYAALAEEEQRGRLATEGLYLTGRFSPGYGDFSPAAQGALLAALNAQRAIGLTATPAGALLPQKSITAVLGIAAQPVAGVAAGCNSCALAGTCKDERKGANCARFNFS